MGFCFFALPDEVDRLEVHGAWSRGEGHQQELPGGETPGDRQCCLVRGMRLGLRGASSSTSSLL